MARPTPGSGRRPASWAARVISLALGVGLAVSVTGCAQPSYRFVSSANRDLVLRVPRHWTALNNDAAVKAAGLDPSTIGWTAFFEASPHPDVAQLQALSAPDPILFAESIPVSKDERASVTGDQLREMVLPGTPAARDEAVKQHTFAVLADHDVTTPTEAGAHITYYVKFSGVTEVFDRIVLTDPKHTSVRVVFVHCSQKCYAAHRAEITDAVTSLTLKSH